MGGGGDRVHTGVSRVLITSVSESKVNMVLNIKEKPYVRRQSPELTKL